MIRGFRLCASLFFLGLGIAALPAHGQTASTAAKAVPAPAATGDLKLDSVGFSDVIDYLQQTTGANFHVNWRALEAAGIAKDTPVTLHLHGVTLRTALKNILDDVAPGGAVTYYTDDGVINITTKDQADNALVTRIYDIQDLLMEIPDARENNNSNISLQSPTRGSIGGGGGNSGGGSVFGGLTPNNNQNGRTQADKAKEIIDLIETTIQPTVWKDTNPTGTATIKVFNGHLIVTAPRSVHEAIGGKR